jgi:flagellar hook-basal body complex protein FliE
MVERIGNGSSLVREAVLAALERQSKQSSAMRELAGELAQGLGPSSAGASSGAAGAAGGDATSFSQRVEDGLAAVEREVRGVDELPAELLSGRIENFHEVAVQLKKAEFTFRFAMEVRNKLIDAYREVMRMSV